jgi:hypothetical protein
MPVAKKRKIAARISKRAIAAKSVRVKNKDILYFKST